MRYYRAFITVRAFVAPSLCRAPMHRYALQFYMSSRAEAAEPPMLNATNENAHSPCKPVIILFLTPAFTTPPIPNAGMTLAIRAALLPNQSLPTLRTLDATPNTLLAPLGRLYRSNPHKCNGVLSSWIPAGARNCATFARLTCLSTSAVMGSIGAMSGGRLKLAKMVKESRSAKSA